MVLPVGLLILAALAAVMASSTALFVCWAAGCRTSLRAAVVVFLLLMMAGMLLGALVYELWPSRQSAVAGLWLASVVMSASAAIVFVAFLRAAQRATAGPSAAFAPDRFRWLVPSVVVLVIVSETLMGWSFGIADGLVARLPGPAPAGVVDQFGSIVVSPWFTFPMVVEMALSLAWRRLDLEGPVLRLLALQPLAMFCSPPSLPGAGWVLGTAGGSTAVMTGALAYLVVLALRGQVVSPRLRWYAGALLFSFGLMAAGLALWAVDRSLALYGASIIAQMVVFLVAVVLPDGRNAGPLPTGPETGAAVVVASRAPPGEETGDVIRPPRREGITYAGRSMYVALKGPSRSAP